jgi:hypothetical protein
MEDAAHGRPHHLHRRRRLGGLTRRTGRAEFLEPRLDGTTRLPDCLRDVIVCHVLELRQDSVARCEQFPQKIGLFHDARVLPLCGYSKPREAHCKDRGKHFYGVARGSTTATGGDSSIRSLRLSLRCCRRSQRDSPRIEVPRRYARQCRPRSLKANGAARRRRSPWAGNMPLNPFRQTAVPQRPRKTDMWSYRLSL